MLSGRGASLVLPPGLSLGVSGTRGELSPVWGLLTPSPIKR